MGQLRATQFRIDSFEELEEGRFLVRGNLTKTGVFEYHRGDSVVRELRSDEEVFDERSTRTLLGASVTYDHPNEFVTNDNRDVHEVGTVVNVKAAPPYVEGELVIRNDAISKKIRNGYLKEMSCGYTTVSKALDGGEADYSQTQIRYNHVALGPEGWGRLGRDVGLTLDSNGDQEITRFLHGAEASNPIGDDMSDEVVETTDTQEALPLEDHPPLREAIAELAKRVDSLVAKLTTPVPEPEKPYSEEVKLDSADEIKAKIETQVEKALGLELRARAAYEAVWPTRKCDSSRAVGKSLCEELLGMDSEHGLGLEELVVRSEIAAATAKREREAITKKEDSARRAVLLGVPDINPGVSTLAAHILGK